MRALGYLYKKTVQNEGWIDAPHIVDVYALSDCISQNFGDYIPHWRHNGFWLFDTPAIIEQLALEQAFSLFGLKLFYYEAYEQQYNENEKTWAPFDPERGFVTNVVPPRNKKLEGYDVVSFSCGTCPECSPLSCNGLAENVVTNEHCLFVNLEDAKAALVGGKFDDGEPGPFRIVAVYSVLDPSIEPAAELSTRE